MRNALALQARNFLNLENRRKGAIVFEIFHGKSTGRLRFLSQTASYFFVISIGYVRRFSGDLGALLALRESNRESRSFRSLATWPG